MALRIYFTAGTVGKGVGSTVYQALPWSPRLERKVSSSSYVYLFFYEVPFIPHDQLACKG